MAKKITLIVVGIVLLLCGLGAIVPGIFLTVATSNDGALKSGYHSLNTATPALVSPAEQVANGSSVPTSGFGSTTITISVRSASQPMFVGIAPASDVERYFDGVAYDEIREFRLSPYRVNTVEHNGLPLASPPGDENFWTAQATGTNPTLDWQVTSGDYRVVLMNVDGSPGVDSQAQFGIKVEGLRGIGIGAMIFGILLALVGVVLLIWGIRTPGRPAQPAPATGYPPGPPPYQPPSAGLQPTLRRLRTNHRSRRHRCPSTAANARRLTGSLLALVRPSWRRSLLVPAARAPVGGRR
jgi:hypothetical protein